MFCLLSSITIYDNEITITVGKNSCRNHSLINVVVDDLRLEDNDKDKDLWSEDKDKDKNL